MTYELFWAGDAHETGNGFWTESLEPFRFTEPPFKGELTIGQDDWILRSADSPEHARELAGEISTDEWDIEIEWGIDIDNADITEVD